MIRALNLDSLFVPTAYPEIEFESFKFSGGEYHIKLSTTIDYSDVEKVIITHRIKNGDNIMLIMFAVDALRSFGIKRFDLIIPYIPYARQDRRCWNGESFTLKIFAKLINLLSFDCVHVVDAHSGISTALIDNCIETANTDWVHQAINNYVNDKQTYENHKLILISPDMGSRKKSLNLLSTGRFDGFLQGEKIRNPKNGELSGFNIINESGIILTNECDCIIVDDICDGGGTFIGLAKELKKRNVGNLYLFVTHGIFSKGFDELNKYFTKIYCTNSFKDIEDSDKLKQLKIYL